MAHGGAGRALQFFGIERSGRVRCANCGTDNPEAARACRGCGELLEGPTINVPAMPDSPYAQRSRRLTQLIVLGAVVLLLFFCVFLAISAIPRG